MNTQKRWNYETRKPFVSTSKHRIQIFTRKQHVLELILWKWYPRGQISRPIRLSMFYLKEKRETVLKSPATSTTQRTECATLFLDTRHVKLKTNIYIKQGTWLLIGGRMGE